MEISPCSEEEALLDALEFDPDYEFDAARFFDFAQPETPSEAEEADRWFGRAPSYPPSPFITKPYRGLLISLNNEKVARYFYCQLDRIPINDDAATEEDAVVPEINRYHDVTDQDPPARATAKLQSQSYMKPTASYLAKQNQSQEFQFHRILRSRNAAKDHKTSSSSSSSNEIQVTKRQKLDIGYLRKERKADEWILGRPKVTIPREFFLETARRSMRHRAKNENVSIGQITSNIWTPAAYASNHKDSKIPVAKDPLPVEMFKKLSIDSDVLPIPRYQSTSLMSTEDTKGNM